jgi:hypothetical protein
VAARVHSSLVLAGFPEGRISANPSCDLENNPIVCRWRAPISACQPRANETLREAKVQSGSFATFVAIRKMTDAAPRGTPRSEPCV